MDPIGTLKSCFALAKYIHDKRDELRQSDEGVAKLCEKVARLVPALHSMLSTPAKISTKVDVIRALERSLTDCKAFVDKYQHRGGLGRMMGLMTGKDTKNIDSLNSDLNQLLIEFLAVNAADVALRDSTSGGGGKFGVSFRRAKWSEISFYKGDKKSGASSDVYMARWDHKDCAVKIIRPNSSLDLRPVFRELEIISKLAHPNIIQTHAICEDLDQAYGPVAIVMEWAACGDLQQVLERDAREDDPRRRLSFQHLIFFAIGICDAMSYCAQKSIIHRDLKSKNIVVTEKYEAKVCDFGMSKLVESGKTQLTIENSGIGTPEYNAPEVLRGNKDERFLFCDIYSFGVVLHEMITRQRPWEGKSPMQLFRRAYKEKTSFFLSADRLPPPPPSSPSPQKAPAPSEPIWYFSDGGQRSAPLTRSSLVQAFGRGEVVSDTPVWTEGMREWVALEASSLWPDCQAVSPRQSLAPSLPPPAPVGTPSLEQRRKEEELRATKEALEREQREAEQAKARLEAAEHSRRLSMERHELDKQREVARRIKLEAEEKEMKLRLEAEARAKAEAEAKAKAAAEAEVENAVAALTTAQQVVTFVKAHAKDSASMQKGALALMKKISGLAEIEVERLAFAEAGAGTSEFWTWLVSVLREHVKSATVSEEGCRAVGNLSGHNPANQAKLGEVGGCEAVVAALREHVKSAAVSEEGCRAVCILSYGNPANETKMGEVGGCEAVVAALREHVKSVAVCKWGCWAVYELSFNPTNMAKLASSGARALVQSISADASLPEESRIKAKDALRHFN